MRNSENNRDKSLQIEIFKQCPACEKVWPTRENMLADNDVYIIGYQAHFENLSLGLFLFNHSCNGTFSIPADEFIDMYNGPVFDENLSGTKDCPGYCRHQKQLEPCPMQCECAYIREIIQMLKENPVKSNRIPR